MMLSHSPSATAELLVMLALNTSEHHGVQEICDLLLSTMLLCNCIKWYNDSI